MNVEEWHKGLWQTFAKRAPVISTLKYALNDLQNNDHVAFRCLGVYPFDLNRLETGILNLGYYALEDYYFEEKQLRARSYIHPTYKELKRVFLSEPIIESFSDDTVAIASVLAQKVPRTHCESPSIFFNPRPWRESVSFEEYEEVASESEYISWVLVNGAIPNHFTLSVPENVAMESVLQRVEDLRIKVNESGGRVKNAGGNLEQGSTMADGLNVVLKDPHTIYTIPTCFYEFAKRRHGFDGFIEANANKIFESTNRPV